MSRKRKQYSPEFKAKVALSTVKNEGTVSRLTARYEVHPTCNTHLETELA